MYEPSQSENKRITLYPVGILVEDPIGDDNIHQLDGNVSIEEMIDIDSEFNFDLIEKTNLPNINKRNAPFNLNQAKQLNSIVSDALKTNIEISANDNDGNIDMKCSSGFYDQVTKPALCGLSKDFKFHMNGISGFCRDVTINHDISGYEYNITFFFNLSFPNTNVASVTIHLHHSTRNAQIQGGSVMPDKSKAAMWFLKNIIHGRIELLAHKKKISVAQFNAAIITVANDHIQTLNNSKICGDCQTSFNGQSRPMFCKQCRKYFHSTRCFKAHKCSSRYTS